jgi:hypothetical protein
VSPTVLEALERSARIVAGLLSLALVVPLLALPGMVALSIMRTFGWVGIFVVLPIMAAWLMIAVPLIALATRLILPDLAERGTTRSRRRAAQTRRVEFPRFLDPPVDHDEPFRPSVPAPKFSDLYGLRAPMLTAIAALAVAGTLVVWLVAI